MKIINSSIYCHFWQKNTWLLFPWASSILCFLVATTLHAGICSSLLLADKPLNVQRETLTFHSNEKLKLPIEFLENEKRWISEVISNARARIDRTFPAAQLNFIPCIEACEDSVIDHDIKIGIPEIHADLKGIVLHEWAHILFTERLMYDSTFYRFNKILTDEMNDYVQSRKKLSNNNLISVGLLDYYRFKINNISMSGLKFTFTYQELFADLLASLIEDDPKIITSELTTLSELMPKKRSLRFFGKKFSSINYNSIESRSFFTEYHLKFLNQILPTEFSSTKNNYDNSDPHFILAQSRPYIWKELMFERSLHSDEEIQTILDLVYRASRDEIFYRLKRPWLWRLSNDEVNRRFIDRLRDYNNNN